MATAAGLSEFCRLKSDLDLGGGAWREKLLQSLTTAETSATSYGGGAPQVDVDCSAEMIVPSQVALPSRSAEVLCEDFIPSGFPQTNN